MITTARPKQLSGVAAPPNDRAAAIIHAAEVIIGHAIERWSASYGEVVCDVSCVVTPPRPSPDEGPMLLVLRGTVLVPAQRRRLESDLLVGLHGMATVDAGAVQSLTEGEDAAEWLSPAAKRLDVAAAPAMASAAPGGTTADQSDVASASSVMPDLRRAAEAVEPSTQDGRRVAAPDRPATVDGPPATSSPSLATQVTAADPPLRLLCERREWAAVELADGTVGWVRRTDTVETPAARRPVSVEQWRRAFRGAFTPASSEAWRKAAQAWLGAPYLWGGTLPAGVDCSGLTQRLYREVCGLGLPKHSADQVAAGRRISLSAAGVGDLVYLTRLEGGVKHVAVIVDASPRTVVHASRERGVTFEPLESLLRRYRVRAVARFGRRGGDAGR